MDWQMALVVVFLTVATLYLIKKARGTWSGQKAGCAGGCGSGCNRSTENATQRTFIPEKELALRNQ